MRLRIREFLTFAVFAVTCTAVMTAQSTDSGVVKGGIYTNEYFKLTWELPKDWAAQSGNDQPDSGGNHKLLHLTNFTGSGESIDLVAEDNRQHPRFAYGYEQRLEGLLVQAGWKGVTDKISQQVDPNAYLVFKEFQSPDTNPSFAAFALMSLRGYELKFIVTAISRERIEAIVRDSLNVKIRPDWEAPDPVYTFNQQGSKQPTVRTSQTASQGLLIHKVQPVYPPLARERKIQGTVIMRAIIDRVGKIAELWVIEGDPLLTPAAIEAVSQWRYKPYLLSEQPVVVETQITVIFSLQN